MRKGATAMLKPIEKPTRRTLIHHPTDTLDAFCHYDATSSVWVKFDTEISHQLIQLEFANRQYIRVRQQSSRRISN
jgi:hypothetical protein